MVDIQADATAIASAAGAAVSMAFIEGTVKYKIALFCGGFAASHYLTPYAVKYFQLAESGGAAFIIGIFAMSLTAAIIRVLKGVDFKSLFDQLGLWFGRK